MMNNNIKYIIENIFNNVNNKISISLQRLDDALIGEDLITYNFIDLGLPSGTCWADRNLGSTSIYKYGKYFLHGIVDNINISPEGNIDNVKKVIYNKKDNYDWLPSLNNYIYNNLDNLKDNELVVKSVIGPECRMPSKKDIEELLEYTTQKWVNKIIDKNNIVRGCIFTSLKNGKLIFVPLSGYYFYTYDFIEGQGDDFMLWSSTFKGNDMLGAYCLVGNYDDEIFLTDGPRYDGYNIRAVKLKMF